MKREFILALVKEIGLKPIAAGSPPPVIESLYFGGGTPSLLDEQDLLMIFASLNEKFILVDDIEITLEANPDDITASKLLEWRTMGINRLSVGIQSFNDEELKWMNRSHTAAASCQCINQIIEAGFSNFSVDLIYGSPLLTDREWEENLSRVSGKNVPHVSCYALTVEPNTALHKMIDQKLKKPVDPGKQAGQFLLLMDWMRQAGYEHYEISNFAKPDMRSRHNSSYWSGAAYFGFGPSAHSFSGRKRSWNIANNALYIKNIQEGIIPAEEEILTPNQQLNEYIMTSLRTIDGLDLDHVSSTFGIPYSQQLLDNAKKWEAGGKLKTAGQKIILTNEGKLFADGIAAGLFF